MVGAEARTPGEVALRDTASELASGAWPEVQVVWPMAEANMEVQRVTLMAMVVAQRPVMVVEGPAVVVMVDTRVSSMVMAAVLGPAAVVAMPAAVVSVLHLGALCKGWRVLNNLSRAGEASPS